MKKKFVWQKWNSPIEEAWEERIYEDPIVIDEYDEAEMEEEEIVPKRVPINLIAAIVEQNKLLNSFDFWILHTNFDINNEVKKIIESTPGVETAEPLTRYRVKLGFTISGLFDNSKVKQDIQDALTKHDISATGEESALDLLDFSNQIAISAFGPEVQESILSAQKELEERGLYWSIYVFPSGAIDTCEKNTQEEMDEHLAFLIEVESLIGGRVILSKNYNV